ncbi:MAG TPA: cytochrome c3 family protein [Deltaproteobacteria bacterium]|nr:cytochrome c3 family protein [Deltaproteobacteria bacterium]HPR52559.1 cytochrome c3 family protein [Deltaproteobacteria bacterium]
MDTLLLADEPHVTQGCDTCHKGNNQAETKEEAHEGMIARPSDNLDTCMECHEDVSTTYGKSIHYTTIGQREGVKARFTEEELKIFDEKVFEQSCRSCHASCGDCHVKSPPVSGISLGLIDGHSFISRREGKTCAFCHGGRVYPEYTGEYGATTDVHYQEGMMCLDCHKKQEFHGDGKMYMSKQEVADRPKCIDCHEEVEAKELRVRVAHDEHKGKVSCFGCHTDGEYRNCYSCHMGTGSKAQPGFILGKNPRNPDEVTTLRIVPSVRDTFEKAGILQGKFDHVPNYWNTPAHKIKKRTDRTRSCDSCHTEKKGFLTEKDLLDDGARINRSLIHVPKPITQ